MTNDPIPTPTDKLYFKIGEAADILGVETHVLRFWENEFKRFIKPKRTTAGQRLYRRRDVEMFGAIKTLLHEHKYTIQGARQHLAAHGGKERSNKAITLAEIRSELEKIRNLLS